VANGELRIRWNGYILVEKKYNEIGGVDMHTATVSAKGWIVIPKVYRDKYDLKSGRKVQVVDYGGGLSIIPFMEDPVEQGLGALRRFGGNESWTEALLKERAAERAREERED
jgi:AbrB family looped-hinge helix DNA binding protein